MAGRHKVKTTEQFIKEAIELHGGLYTYLFAHYTGAHNKIIITCKIHGNFEQTPRNHLFGRKGFGQGCKECSKVYQHTANRLTNEDIDKYLMENNIQIKRLSDYKNSFSIMNWGCLECENIWPTSSNAIRQGCGCPVCNDTKLTNEDIDNFLLNNNIPIKRLNDHINSYTKNNWQCLSCDYIWPAQSCEIMRGGEDRQGSGCPNCSRGRNERIVGEALAEIGIKTSKMMIKHSSGKKMFPDYHCPDINLLIEYNGVQHYRPASFSYSVTKKEAELIFQKQQLRDQMLRDYCLEKGIKLLEIDGRKYKGDKLKKFVKEYFMNGDSYGK